MSVAIESMAIEMPEVMGHPNRAGFRGVLTMLDVPSDRPPAGARGHRVLLTRAAAEAALPSLLGMGLDYTPGLDRHDVRRKVGVITEANIVPGRGEESGPGGVRGNADRGELSHGKLPSPRLRSVEVGHQEDMGHQAESGKALKAEAAWARFLHGIHTAAARAHFPPSAAGGGTRIEIAGYLFARDFPELLRELRSGSALGMSYEIADARIDDVRAGIWTVSACTFTGAAVLRRDRAAYGATWIELM